MYAGVPAAWPICMLASPWSATGSSVASSPVRSGPRWRKGRARPPAPTRRALVAREIVVPGLGAGATARGGGGVAPRPPPRHEPPQQPPQRQVALAQVPVGPAGVVEVLDGVLERLPFDEAH